MLVEYTGKETCRLPVWIHRFRLRKGDKFECPDDMAEALIKRKDFKKATKKRASSSSTSDDS